MKLHAFAVSNLTFSESAQFLTRLLADWDQQEFFQTDSVIEDLIAKIRQQLPDFHASLHQVRRDEHTKTITEADQLRDMELAALRAAVNAFRTSRREEEQKAYTQLRDLLLTVKMAERSKYETETALITSLLRRLDKSPYKEAIDMLGLTRFVTNLRDSQEAFETAFAQRSTSGLQKISHNAKGKRKAIFTSYLQLCDYLAIMVKVKDESIYSQALSVVNNSRSYYAELLARRKGRQQAKGKQVGTGETVAVSRLEVIG